MKHGDLLSKSLSLLLKMRFTDRGVNVNYHESDGISFMDYRDIDYEFQFIEGKGGSTRFVMKMTPEENGLSRKILESLKEDRRISNKTVDDSKYFTNPKISEEDGSLFVDCRLKRIINQGSEEVVFRDQLWGVIMKPAFEKAYGY